MTTNIKREVEIGRRKTILTLCRRSPKWAMTYELYYTSQSHILGPNVTFSFTCRMFFFLRKKLTKPKENFYLRKIFNSPELGESCVCKFLLIIPYLLVVPVGRNEMFILWFGLLSLMTGFQCIFKWPSYLTQILVPEDWKSSFLIIFSL